MTEHEPIEALLNRLRKDERIETVLNRIRPLLQADVPRNPRQR